MKNMGIAATALLFTACCNQPESTVRLFDAQAFTATVEGKPVSLYTLRCAGLHRDGGGETGFALHASERGSDDAGHELRSSYRLALDA